MRKVSDNGRKKVSDNGGQVEKMASLKKSFRVSPELWDRLQKAKQEGESDSAAICRLLAVAIDREGTAQDSDLPHLWAQIDRKDEQIRTLSALLEEANTAKLTALLETCQATAKACETSATQTRALVKALDAPSVIEAKVSDVDIKPVGEKKRSWIDRLFG